MARWRIYKIFERVEKTCAKGRFDVELMSEKLYHVLLIATCYAVTVFTSTRMS